jgi:gliding motility-associated-like protein
LFSAAATTSAQIACPPPNIGFEDGTFDKWQCDTGRIDRAGNITVSPSGVIYDRHTIVSKGFYPKFDEFGNFPTLCPNGSKYSIKLGSTDTVRLAERVSYTFSIPSGATQYNIIFSYAVVLQNPRHNANQQPRFTVKTFDVTDNTFIDCASFDFVAADNLPGFKLSTAPATRNAFIYYKDWSSSTINLNGYAGKTVRIEFTANDCALGGHFGYAYLDLKESCTSLITGNAYCNGQKSATLSSPSGFGYYTWYNANDLTAPIGNSQTLTITPAPPDKSSYAVILKPTNTGTGCIDTLYTVVDKINSGFTFKVQDTIYACGTTPVDLTSPIVTAGSDTGLVFSYSADAQGLNYLRAPDNITQNGTYYVGAVSPEGCTNILPVTVIFINDSLFKITNPPPVVYPQTVDVTGTFTHYSSLIYTYYSDKGATRQINGTNINQTGTYYIKAFSPRANCSVIAPVNVVIGPPAPPVVNAVNTFTPNNDGVNDHFFVTVNGFETFDRLKIYNRDGQLVFQTTNATAYWDGTVSGKAGNVGTYYWVFEGTDTYYRKKVYQSGYITLIR